MKQKNTKFPFTSSYFDRHGKKRWRYRHKGVSAELGTQFGSDEFKKKYDEAVARHNSKLGAGKDRTRPGTFDDLVARFYRLHFPNIQESTRADYRSVIEPLRKHHGHKRVSHMRVRHVLEIKADLADTPQQANKTLKRLSQLMDLAVKLEWRADNPVKGVGHFQSASTGYHTWNEAEIARFYDVHKLGTPAHLAMTLMLYTGAAKVDAVQMGISNIRDGRIVYRRQKTRKNPSGIEVNIPIHPDLASALSTVANKFTFLETRQGRPRTTKGLGSSMRKWCDKAGLHTCSSHGLRKAICRRIAEAGGTSFEIMSVSGHVTLSEAERYCATFGRIALSDSAFAKMEGTKSEQNVTNHPARFAKKSTN
ncbi:tyrosine-type recombinase/integrase [Fluviibacterium sp. S390]|uniref:tyrosine-type recombinase/integrase n=1 Tax=Fluviibacterium sp. S390 TaxID=3415139 RepID=UPI003C7E3E0D